MHSDTKQQIRTGLAKLSLALLLAGLSVGAQATLLSPVTVRLLAPGGFTDGGFTDATPISASDSVSTGSGITPGDGSAIGDWMLDNETVQFDGNSIHLRLAAGAESPGGEFSTGYLGLGGQHARYEFDGLAVGGATIIGFNLYAADGFGAGGFSGVSAGVSASLLSPSLLSFNIDDLLFVDRGLGGSLNYADFRIDLLTRPDGGGNLPEPSSWALALLALTGAGLAARRRRQDPQ